MAGYKSVAQFRGHQVVMTREAQQNLDELITKLGCSRIFNSKYRGKCTACEGTGIIAQGNECVMADGKIYHFECFVRHTDRQTPCGTCGATGDIKQAGPKSNKRVCCTCATAEVLGS